MALNNYKDITLTVDGRIGTITLNRPKALNSFSPLMFKELVDALRFLEAHEETVFTVITGEGRFFSAGVDVGGIANETALPKEGLELKMERIAGGSLTIEMMRLMIDHTKVLVIAYNGPAVGGGAAWFPAMADIVLVSDSCWLQIPFSALGLVPELGSVTFREHMGVRRTTEFLMFGRKLSAQELEGFGIANQIFPTAGFHQRVNDYLKEQLEVNDSKSMMETKRLIVEPLRERRMLAVFRASDALAEMFVEKRPAKRFAMKQAELEAKRKAKQAGASTTGASLSAKSKL
ncbi:hypothetical protein SmJEL517_g06134 [Synchytrium microbalum]|uniref:Uncharacterized protein n=1 Tax=Synchytrium microbalum TaxID=1806994 RepID=A0A507BK48_9FUNG|nr:uncharacterized protein SmJEL517_g06134 [Synchytrium microbalum]TPX30267.1 hypothetical protein SmJEL517_g06134 [Synchytrium microbalum]